METERPSLIVLSGPNGAGKSTAAPALLPGTLGVVEFVNADVIAQGLSAFQPERAALEAGRIMLRRVRQLADQRVSFAFETTLAGRHFAPWIADLRRNGYIFELLFLWLPNPEMAVTRVAHSVQAGGHAIPDATIRRRYGAGLRNFFELYRPLADTWRFYDNSHPSSPRLLAAGEGNSEEVIGDASVWNSIVKGSIDEGKGEE
jgi:predicted ABC-type ATPase